MPYTIRQIKEFVPRSMRGANADEDPAKNSVLENIKLLRDFILERKGRFAFAGNLTNDLNTVLEAFDDISKERSANAVIEGLSSGYFTPLTVHASRFVSPEEVGTLENLMGYISAGLGLQYNSNVKVTKEQKENVAEMEADGRKRVKEERVGPEERTVLERLDPQGANPPAENELKAIEKDHAEKAQQFSMIRAQARQMAMDAKEKLERLEKMTKNGHTDTPSFTAMKETLKSISTIDADNTSLQEINFLLGKLEEKANAYKTGHDRFFRRRWGFGNDRFKMSKELVNFAKLHKQAVGGMSEGLQYGTDEKLTDRMNFHASVVNKVDDFRAKNAHNISANDLADKLGMPSKETVNEIKRTTEAVIPGTDKQMQKGIMTRPQ